MAYGDFTNPGQRPIYFYTGVRVDYPNIYSAHQDGAVYLCEDTREIMFNGKAYGWVSSSDVSTTGAVTLQDLHIYCDKVHIGDRNFLEITYKVPDLKGDGLVPDTVFKQYVHMDYKFFVKSLEREAVNDTEYIPEDGVARLSYDESFENSYETYVDVSTRKWVAKTMKFQIFSDVEDGGTLEGSEPELVKVRMLQKIYGPHVNTTSPPTCASKPVCLYFKDYDLQGLDRDCDLNDNHEQPCLEDQYTQMVVFEDVNIDYHFNKLADESGEYNRYLFGRALVITDKDKTYNCDWMIVQNYGDQIREKTTGFELWVTPRDKSVGIVDFDKMLESNPIILKYDDILRWNENAPDHDE